MKIIGILLILLTITFLSQAQRGGGSRSSSKSSGFGGGRSRGWSSHRSSSYGNSYYRNNYYGSGYGNHHGPTDYTWLLIIGAGIGGVGYYAYKQSAKQAQLRRQKVKQMFDSYQAMNQGNMCTLEPQQKAASRDWFMSQKWTMRFQTNSGSFVQNNANVILEDIREKSMNSYHFSMRLHDQVGSSKATGILMHQADYFGIKFQKLYDNRNAAGQTGQFDILVYEGVQQGETFRGNWYYQGFQGNPQYSGAWEMFHF